VTHFIHGIEDKRQGGQNFCWRAFGRNKFSKRKKMPIMDVDGCNDLIIVSSNYFLKNKDLIEAWAMKKILR
jgi:hypothetical protein